MNNNELKQFKTFSRLQYFEIWKKVKAGNKLEGEEKIIGELMQQHKEFYNDWESTNFDYEYDPDTEVNPFLHIQFDIIVVNQMNNDNPAQTKITYGNLIKHNHSHLEAIHKIASVFAEEIWDVLSSKKEFNEKIYIDKLIKLK
jgi:hypothetical protein